MAGVDHHRQPAPMGLTYRVGDAQTIEISTPRALANRATPQLYKAPQLAGNAEAAEKFIGRIESIFGQHEFRAGGGPGEIAFDPKSSALIVSLPDPQQRALAVLLKAMRGGAPNKAP